MAEKIRTEETCVQSAHPLHFSKEQRHPDAADTMKMAKKQGETEQVRLPVGFTRRARVIAAARGISVSDYILEKMEPVIENLAG